MNAYDLKPSPPTTRWSRRRAGSETYQVEDSMKAIRWLKSDAKRAEKMGWCLVERTNKRGIGTGFKVCAMLSSTTLPTDFDARKLVMHRSFVLGFKTPEQASCHKAIMLCLGGVK